MIGMTLGGPSHSELGGFHDVTAPNEGIAAIVLSPFWAMYSLGTRTFLVDGLVSACHVALEVISSSAAKALEEGRPV
jgi:hypothetical protein